MFLCSNIVLFCSNAVTCISYVLKFVFLKVFIGLFSLGFGNGEMHLDSWSTEVWISPLDSLKNI